MGCSSSGPVGRGHTFADLYRIGGKLGKGNYAVVYRAQHKETGKWYAVKCFDSSRYTEDQHKALQREVHLMGKLDHPNVVDIYDFFDERRECYLVMEELTGGELFSRIVSQTKFSEYDAQKVMRTLTNTVIFCHEQGVVHRDLKPENILMSSADADATIKIADFGLATAFDESQAASQLVTRCGTPGYTAPEVLMHRKYGKAVDVWSMGVILYIMLCGYPPFTFGNQFKLMDQIKNARYEFDDAGWAGVSAEAKDLVSKILVADPAQRYTTQQILDHPWMREDRSAGVQLDKALSQLRRFNARRKLKTGMAAVQSMVRIRLMAGAALSPSVGVAAHSLLSLATALSPTKATSSDPNHSHSCSSPEHMFATNYRGRRVTEDLSLMAGVPPRAAQAGAGVGAGAGAGAGAGSGAAAAAASTAGMPFHSPPGTRRRVDSGGSSSNDRTKALRSLSMDDVMFLGVLHTSFRKRGGRKVLTSHRVAPSPRTPHRQVPPPPRRSSAFKRLRKAFMMALTIVRFRKGAEAGKDRRSEAASASADANGTEATTRADDAAGTGAAAGATPPSPGAVAPPECKTPDRRDLDTVPETDGDVIDDDDDEDEAADEDGRDGSGSGSAGARGAPGGPRAVSSVANALRSPEVLTPRNVFMNTSPDANGEPWSLAAAAAASSNGDDARKLGVALSQSHAAAPSAAAE